MTQPFYGKAGFTLSEVLITLAIVAVVATLTIPTVLGPVLTCEQKRAYNPKAKDTVSMVQSVFTEYQMENAVTSATSMANLTPYMNYVKIDSTHLVDDAGDPPACGGTVPSIDCANAAYRCLVLANGATLIYKPATTLNGTGTLNALDFYVDPDGKYTNNGSAWMFLYLNGNALTRGHVIHNTVNSAATYPNNDPQYGGYDPGWLEWK